MKDSHLNSLVFVTSDLYYVKGFLINQIIEASRIFDVYIIVNSTESDIHKLFGNTVKYRNFNIRRKISPAQDLLSLISLIIFFIKIKPSIVHSTTPKAGLLAMISAFFAGVSFRLHTFTGQVWQTKRGLYRFLLKKLDQITSNCATHILCDSHGQRKLLIEEKIIDKEKSRVLLNGSIRGVDPNRFSPNLRHRAEVRNSIGIQEDATLILYMARFTRDKGAIFMAEAFREIVSKYKNVFLLMVGPDEEHLSPTIENLLKEYRSHYSLLSYTDCPEKFFAASDVFCLPSFREGFPMVLLNAASTAVPVVASRIYGSEDVVIDNKTGFLFNPGDRIDLVSKLSHLVSDKNLSITLGQNARNFAINNFSEFDITAALMKLYIKRSFSENSNLN